MEDDRVVCETPTPGKKPTRIVKWKYDLVRKAILKSIPKRGEGVLFKDLAAMVAGQLTVAEKERLGSIGWYTTAVKLDLEAKGEIYRLPKETPQRLLRT